MTAAAANAASAKQSCSKPARPPLKLGGNESAMTSAPSPARPAPFYANAPIYFALALLATVAGFFPSYFAKLGATDAAHHFHGIMATLWMVMLIAQGWSARVRRFPLHRWVGWSSVVIAPLFVVSGLLMVRIMLAAADGFSRTYGGRLAFVDVTTMLGFGAAYGLAIYHRRQIGLHARYLAATAVMALPPGLARLLGHWAPGIRSFEAAFHGGYFLAELVVAALIVDDYRKGKIRAPYVMLGALLVGQQVGFRLLSPG